MDVIVVAIACLIVLAGVFIVLQGLSFSRFVIQHKDNRWFYLSAILGRLVVGGLLLLSASESKFPSTIDIIGFIVIVTGIGLSIIGHDRFKQLVGVLFERFVHLTNFAGVLAIIFGAFLAYAYI